MIFNGTEINKNIEEFCDYVIIGSGAAGGVCAKVLAENGQEVVVLEEGPYIKTEEFTANTWQAMKTLFRDCGNTVMLGKSIIPFIQGCCVGGTTTINAAICWRLPEDVYDFWKKHYGIGEVINYEKLNKCFAEIEKELNIHPVSEDIAGNNNLFMKRGVEKKGWAGNFINRNEKNCQGSALCLEGCPNNAKQSTNISYIPMASALGARIYANCRAETILTDNNRAKGVIGFFKSPGPSQNSKTQNYKIIVKAKKGVILAASTIQTPALLIKNKLANSSGQLGKNLQCHPGTAMIGFFEEEVKYWEGATQGYESTEFRKNKRFKLEALALAPELFAVRIPGVGKKLIDYLAQSKHYMTTAVQVRARAKGTIRVLAGRPNVNYSLLNEDVQAFREGTKAIAEMMFAAGAKFILPGIFGLPEKITSIDELKLFEEIKLSPRSFSIIITHMMGAARMHKNKKQGVVKPTLETHDVKNLYITDSSVFPTNLGVNPQHTIMGLARYACNLMLDS